MRIGIITQPLLNNYGGLLQNYALQQVLIRMGHNPITIDQFLFSPKSLIWKIYSEIRNSIRNMVVQGDKTISRRKFEKAFSRVSPNTRCFIDKYINHSVPVYGYKETRELAESLDLDAYIVGSDQVWRKAFNSRLLNSFLDFTTGWDVKRIAYAASLGIDYWEFQSQETEVIKGLIKQFDAVSVRESSAVDLCKQYLEITVKHVLDPTMLLNKEDYVSIINGENEPDSNGDLFCYVLDPNTQKENLIDVLEEQTSMHRFTILPNERITREKPLNMKAMDLPPVTRWLKAFDDAKYVVTDSFHGVVFSILFNKPFVAIMNRGRGNARFDSLLTLFGLNNRIVNIEDQLVNIPFHDIDWNKVNHIRNKMKEYSLDYLKSNLEE